jgi:Zn-dependent protease with chaperone function
MDLLRFAGIGAAIQVQPWPSETPLFALVVAASVVLWLALAISIIGIAYALLIAVGLFFAHVAYVAHVRGSAVRLGPDQLPELYARVVDLARRTGIDVMPEAYVMEAGGQLNALAMRFLRSRMVVLFSDLLEACGDDHAARDMIIGHELGHIRAGHLDWQWLLAPGMLFPFLGNACSRAREHTCDRYGAALCGDPAGALRGLAILAAGGHYGPRVNVKRLAAQRDDLDTGWMTIGKWLSSHPPLCERVAALAPSPAGSSGFSLSGPIRAAIILFVMLVLPVLIVALVAVTIAMRVEGQAKARTGAAVGSATDSLK